MLFPTTLTNAFSSIIGTWIICDRDIIVGRIEPKIYAFTTDTIPKYLKVGDTYREVSVRLGEWEKVFGKDKIVKEGEWSAAIDDNLYFRDYSVHSYLINHGKNRIDENDFPNAPSIKFLRQC